MSVRDRSLPLEDAKDPERLSRVVSRAMSDAAQALNGGLTFSENVQAEWLEFDVTTATATATGTIAVQEEGATIVAAAGTVNFVGAGATVTSVGGVATVTVPGSSLAVKDEGSQILAAAVALDFVGTGVTVTDGGSNVATITISGEDDLTFHDEDLLLLWVARPKLLTAAYITIGDTSISIGSSATASVSGTNRAYMTSQTGAISGDANGVNQSGFSTLTRRVLGPIFQCRIRLPASLTNRRFFLGLSSGSLQGTVVATASAAAVGQYFAVFALDASVNANWLTMSADGANKSGADTGIAGTTSAEYYIEVDMRSGVVLRMNGTAFTLSSNLPTTTADIGPHAIVETRAASAASFDMGTFELRHRQ